MRTEDIKCEGIGSVSSCENMSGLNLKEQIFLNVGLSLCEVLLWQSTSVMGAYLFFLSV